MGSQTDIAPLLSELQNLLSSISSTLQSAQPVNVSSALQPPPGLFHPSPSLYPVQPPHSSIPRLNPVPAHPPIPPIPGSSVNPSRKSFTEIIRDSILSQPIVRHANRPTPQTRSSQQNQSKIANRIASQRVSSKLSRLRALSEKGKSVCYRCGASDHHTVSCRSSLVCFACNQTGHRSARCPSSNTLKPPNPSPSSSHLPHSTPQLPPSASSTTTLTFPTIPSTPHTPPVTMLSPPAPALLAESNILPVMRYYATPGTIALRQSISQGVVLRDIRLVGPEYLLSCLRLLFNIDWNWNIRELPDFHYLVSPPSEEWKENVLRAGEVAFGGIVFPATKYDFRFFNEGIQLKEYWIRVYGYPQDLWRDTELRQLARDLGGIFIAHDSQSSLIALRLKIGVPDKEVISACRRLIFTDQKGISHSHIVQIQVEDSNIPLWGSTRIPIFDANFIRENSMSPQPSPAISDNILMLAQPGVAAANPNPALNPLLVDLNNTPDDSPNLANPTFLEALIQNPLDMQSMIYNGPIPLPNSPLPEIGSPQMPLSLFPQLDMHPRIQELVPPNSPAPLPQPIAQPPPPPEIPEAAPLPQQIAQPPPPPEIPEAAIAQADPAVLNNAAPEDPIMQVDQPENPPLPQAPAVDQPALQMVQQINPAVQALPGAESEARHSLRLKVKEVGGTSKYKGKQGNSSDTQEVQDSGDTEGARHGSGDLDLSDYLVARMESETSLPERALAFSDDSSSSMDCSSSTSVVS